jgi:hypothetical protein
MNLDVYSATLQFFEDTATNLQPFNGGCTGDRGELVLLSTYVDDAFGNDQSAALPTIDHNYDQVLAP